MKLSEPEDLEDVDLPPNDDDGFEEIDRIIKKNRQMDSVLEFIFSLVIVCGFTWLVSWTVLSICRMINEMSALFFNQVRFY